MGLLPFERGDWTVVGEWVFLLLYFPSYVFLLICKFLSRSPPLSSIRLGGCCCM